MADEDTTLETIQPSEIASNESNDVSNEVESTEGAEPSAVDVEQEESHDKEDNTDNIDTETTKEPEEAEDGSEEDEDKKDKKKKDKKKKEKKDKKDKKEKRKKKKEEKSHKEELIQKLQDDIFGGLSDDDQEEPAGKQADFDVDDDDLESKSKSILNTLVSKKKEEKSKRKRVRDDKKKTKTTKKSRKGEDGEEQEDQDPVSEEEAAPRKELDDFDKVLLSLKLGRRQRKPKDDEELMSQEVEDSAKAFVQKMERAADDDVYENQQNRPALNKVKLLSDVTVQLTKKHLQGYYMDHGVLGVLRKWLEPLPDKSLPNIKVRECMFEILTQLPTPATEDLKSSGVGKAVMFLSKHPQETLANKKIAKQLIEKWSRPIFGLSTKFKDVENKEEEIEPQYSQRDLTPRKRESHHVTAADLDAEFDKKVRGVAKESSIHARIPEKMSMDFKIRPKSNIDGADDKKKGPKRSLDKLKPKSSKSGLKKVPRAIQVSVEGRKVYL